MQQANRESRVQDSFNLKGISATIGYVSFIENPPADFNSPLVEILLKAGAVLYVKTNIPQTLMTADSENNVFGRTLVYFSPASDFEP